MNIIDWLLIGLLAAGIGAALVSLKRKKGCSCGCEGCSKNCSRKH